MKILAHNDWATSNDYPLRRFAWPDLTEFSYNPHFCNHPVGNYVVEMDRFHLAEGALVITATDVTILQLVWPNGARRYELIGRDGSLLCDPFSSVWYRNLQGLGPYGLLNSANEIDLDVRRFSQKYDLLEHLTYLIGDVNHGHWFFDHYAKAIVADFFKLPPLLIRPLDSVKLESLALASVKALSIPPGITDSALIRCHRLTILSNITDCP